LNLGPFASLDRNQHVRAHRFTSLALDQPTQELLPGTLP
jgi:hypothetical protein